MVANTHCDHTHVQVPTLVVVHMAYEPEYGSYAQVFYTCVWGRVAVIPLFSGSGAQGYSWYAIQFFGCRFDPAWPAHLLKVLAHKGYESLAGPLVEWRFSYQKQWGVSPVLALYGICGVCVCCFLLKPDYTCLILFMLSLFSLFLRCVVSKFWKVVA